MRNKQGRIKHQINDTRVFDFFFNVISSLRIGRSRFIAFVFGNCLQSYESGEVISSCRKFVVFQVCFGILERENSRATPESFTPR